MDLYAARAALIGRFNSSIPETKLHFELVRALYGTTNSIIGASVVAISIVAIAGSLTYDINYAGFFAAFVIVGLWRFAIAVLYHRTEHRNDDPIANRLWEGRALFGAWSFASLVGLMGTYTVTVHPGQNVETLISCCVIGYIAGISSRNASRPFVTIGQISLTCIPFTLALIWQADLVHLALAAFIIALHTSTIFICRTVYDNIISRHAAFSAIENLAQRDTLTGLWNRTALLGVLEARLAALEQSKDVIALIAIDLDRFKDINDTFGHPAGDAVLKEASERIKAVVPCGAEVARIGGDEFFVMIPGSHELSVVTQTTQRILDAFKAPFDINMTKCMCGASVGYAIAPKDGSLLDTVLRNADLALYEAKKLGRGQVMAYSPILSEMYENRIAIEHELQFALSRGQLDLVYQPIVDPRSGRTISCEALLRWEHPELGSISPANFIPIAETTGLIVPIGAWVLRKACAEATRWPADIRLSVNLSPAQLRGGRDIVDVVMAALKETGLPPTRLELEITESILIEDTATTFAIVEELRGHEISVALDDFGTGFSSLSYLNDFKFSTVKIDRKFTQTVDLSPRTAAIIGAIAKITRDLKIELVAEGVETEGQLAHLCSFGIHAIQGYLFSRPVPAHKLATLIKFPIRPAVALRPPKPSREKAAGKEIRNVG